VLASDIHAKNAATAAVPGSCEAAAAVRTPSPPPSRASAVQSSASTPTAVDGNIGKRQLHDDDEQQEELEWLTAYKGSFVSVKRAQFQFKTGCFCSCVLHPKPMRVTHSLFL
jgi:hypothetical protein